MPMQWATTGQLVDCTTTSCPFPLHFHFPTFSRYVLHSACVQSVIPFLALRLCSACSVCIPVSSLVSSSPICLQGSTKNTTKQLLVRLSRTLPTPSFFAPSNHAFPFSYFLISIFTAPFNTNYILVRTINKT